MKLLKRLVPVFIILLICAVLFCFADFSGSKRIRLSDKELPAVTQVSDESIFVSTAKRSKMKKLAASGMLEMYLDEKTMAVCIYDTIYHTLYRSLPEVYAGERPSALSLKVLLDGAEHTLSSQSDSLSFGCTEYEETGDGVIITYSFRRSLERGKKLDISVNVAYTLSDGMLTATVDCDKIHCEGKAVITSLELLPFFGADRGAEKGDYILLPDGCGALLDLGEKADSFDAVSLKVYGEDAAVSDEKGARVLVGAFGRKCKGSAFMCLVSEGESLCEIKADKALEKSGYNRVGAAFAITPSVAEDKYVYISKESYKGRLQLCYRFLSGENADYVAMASAARELLIRQGRLRENAAGETAEYPFNLSLIMSQTKSDAKGRERDICLTSFEQLQELLASLKAKGFSQINVLLKEIYEEGSLKIKKVIGSERDMLSLSERFADGSIRFFAQNTLLQKGRASVKALDGERLDMCSINTLRKNLSSFITQMRRQPFEGISVAHTGEILFSDFSGRDALLREDVKNSLEDIFASLYASKQIMSENGNLYSIKYAGNIINLPSASSLSEKPHFRDVPFVQAILHGILDYSLEAANTSKNSTYAMLKAAEYGALPHYEWYCTSPDENESEDKRYYMNSVGEAKAYYDKMKSDFSDLKSRRITAHEMVKKDVYLTRFGEDCSVYVNYSDEAVSVGGVSIDAKSYALVN